MLRKSPIAIALALVIGVGLIIAVALATARVGALDAGSVPTSTSRVIEPAEAEPLPVVGPSETSEGALNDSANDEGPSTPRVTDDSLIQVPRGDAVSTTLAFRPSTDLGEVSTTAIGYRFVDAGLNRAALVAVLARKFGIEGRPTRNEEGAWVVTPTRRSVPRVRVESGPMVEWVYDWSPQPTSSSPAFPPASAAGTVDGGAAEEVTRAFLASLGVPIDELDWQVESIGGRTVVTGWQVIAGQRTQAGWRMTFTADGQVTQASGFAATPIEIPDLPVLDATAALVRARQPQWSALGPTLLAAAPKPPTSRAPSPAKEAGPDVSTSTGALDQRLISSAELGLAQFSQPDGRLLILPAYVLTAEDGSTWSLVAVADEALSLVSP